MTSILLNSPDQNLKKSTRIRPSEFQDQDKATRELAREKCGSGGKRTSSQNLQDCSSAEHSS